MNNRKLQQAFETAAQHHLAGRIAQAERLYRQVLGEDAGYAERCIAWG